MIIFIIWNVGFIDVKENVGFIENVLEGIEIEDFNDLVEVGMVVCFFDFCLVCIVYVYDNKFGKEFVKFKV